MYALERLENLLNKLSSFQFIIGSAFLAVLCGLFFFSPRLVLFVKPVSGSFEWDRGTTFLRQCDAPFRRDLEDDVAMSYRLLPPLVCWAIGLRGVSAFIVPWLGLLCLLGEVSNRMLAETKSRAVALFATCLTATTSASFVATGWLGINDPWHLLGLVSIALGGWIATPALLCPWVDERFIIGMPLALACRLSLRPNQSLNWLEGGKWLATFLWLVPYAVIRGLLMIYNDDQFTRKFLAGHWHGFVVWLPWAHLGWWMSLRAGWLFVLLLLLTIPMPNERLAIKVALGGLVVATLVVSLVLAADISRSGSIVLPAMLAGVVRYYRQLPRPNALLPMVLAANYALPACHIVYTKVALISPLGLELIRLWRMGT